MKIVLSLFLMGLSFGSGPCLASCGPILLSYTVGTRKNILNSLNVYILFSLARIAVYIALSLTIFFLGQFIIDTYFARFSKYIVTLFGIFLIIIGILTAIGQDLKFPLCQFLHKNLIMHDKKSVMAMGLIIGLMPCAPLLALFSYSGLVAKTALQALTYSISFGLGTFLSPLLILSVAAGIIPNFLRNLKCIYYKILSFVCGSILVFLGIQLIGRSIIQ